MLKNVLVCLDKSAASSPCQQAATDFAKNYGAVLTGLCVEKPLRMGSVYSAGELMTGTDGPARVDRPGVAQLFPGGSTMWSRSHDIPRAAQAFDLIVTDRNELESALVREAARPVMLVSEPGGALEKIAVAYDGSPGADRALALAVDIALHWRAGKPEIVLLAAVGNSRESREFLRPASRYLRLYDVAFTSHIATGPAADALVRLAEEEGANLLCMGAFGHSLARDLFAGSTTQGVMRLWKKPLLLSP